MYYTKGDTPSAALLVAPARDGEPVDLEPFTGASARLVMPDGSTATAAATIDVDDEPVVEVTLPALDVAGLVEVQLILTGTGIRETFDVDPLVVQELTGWHSISSARAEWPDAAKVDDHRLFKLLALARLDVEAYARAADLALPRPPMHLREAQLMQARNRIAAARVDPASGSGGEEGFAIGPFPLDWHIKATIRPARRVRPIR